MSPPAIVTEEPMAGCAKMNGSPPARISWTKAFPAFSASEPPAAGGNWYNSLPTNLLQSWQNGQRSAIRERKVYPMSSTSSLQTNRGFPLCLTTDLRRGEYFAGLFLLGSISGLTSRVIQSVEQVGWAKAFLTTFDVSVIVWISCYAGIVLIGRNWVERVRPLDLIAGVGFAGLAILPVGPLSWIGITGLSIYILNTTAVAVARRGATILLACTVPLFWSRLLFQFFSKFILGMDATLVSLLLGTQRNGTLVEFADRSGQLEIFPSCSSLANVSLAFLCWITLSALLDHKKSRCDFLWCLLACITVIAVNVTRLGVLGLTEWCYTNFHSTLGDAIFSTGMVVLVIVICSLGLRREIQSDLLF